MRRFISMNKKLRDRAILTVMFVVFLFSIFKLIEYRIDSRNNDQLYDQIRTHKISVSTEKSPQGQNDDDVSTSTHSEADDSANQSIASTVKTLAPSIRNGFKPLLKQNPDTVGWIQIKGAPIDYPIVQTTDNDYYLNHNFDRKKSIWGSIFMDYRNSIEQMGRHTILYGHNMNDGSMFAAISRFAKPAFFKKNRIIRFDTLHQTMKWEVFAAYETTTDFYYIQTDFRSKRDYKDFLDSLLERSIVKTEMNLSSDDQILTLSTCTRADDNKRFVVHARRM